MSQLRNHPTSHLNMFSHLDVLQFNSSSSCINVSVEEPEDKTVQITLNRTKTLINYSYGQIQRHMREAAQKRINNLNLVSISHTNGALPFE